MPAALRVLTLLGLFAATGSAAAEIADPSAGSESGAVLARIAPSPLLAIDQNRSTVIDRIVGEWGDALTQANAGIVRINCGRCCKRCARISCWRRASREAWKACAT